VEQNPSWETSSRSPIREIYPLMKPKCSLPCSQKPTTDPYPEPDESSPLPPPSFCNNPPLVPILSQMNPVHFPPTSFYNTPHFSLSWATWIQSTLLPPSFYNTYSNSILPSMPRSSKWYLLLGVADQNCMCTFHLSNSCYLSWKKVRSNSLYIFNDGIQTK